MIVSDIQTSVVPVIKPTDEVQFAMDRMIESRLFDLPVVDEQGQFLGLLSFESLEELDLSASVADSREEWKSIWVNPQDPLIKLLNLMQHDQLTAVAMVDEDQQYLSCLQVHDLVVWIGSQSVVAQPGGLLSLRLAANNYSLSEIARIAESNNGTITSLRVSPDEEAGYLMVHLKLNLMDLTHVMATFERFGYQIAGFNHQSHLGDFYSERYDALMRYLDI